MAPDELALVGDPRDGVDGGAITLDELALVGDPCDSGTGASLGGDVGTGTDVGTSVGSVTGNGRPGNDGEVSVAALLPPTCGSGQVSFSVGRAWRSLMWSTCRFHRRPSETSTK